VALEKNRSCITQSSTEAKMIRLQNKVYRALFPVSRTVAFSIQRIDLIVKSGESSKVFNSPYLGSNVVKNFSSRASLQSQGHRHHVSLLTATNKHTQPHSYFAPTKAQHQRSKWTNASFIQDIV
jgi:hypothetical protein